MHILIIGKNGQVGYELVQACKMRNISFDATARDELDLTDLQGINRFFARHHNYDFVINAAAYTQVDKAEDEPELADLVNHQAVGVIAQMCQQYDIPLLHISTDYVFDGKSEILYSEEDEANPLNIYGKTKHEGEKAVIKYLDKYIILRTGWIFGRQGENFVKKIASLACEKKSLNVVGDVYGCPTSAIDVSRVLLEIILSPIKVWGLYHYSAFPLTTWHQFACAVLRYVPVNNVEFVQPILSHQFYQKALRPKHSGLNGNKLKADYHIAQNNWEKYIAGCLSD
ncbi:dTDP-4-dehydrorhamnose reductase [Cysteiniphilum sp. JM-1]|uniref:dTDP-4-dehydrorhamnose reductase n=1 Tax=Cysteiniphilum TaxID=2056696 RepID=UPI0012455D90|nr:dTDP-4-dehydrorhamnose reductase [Cysteiniphilum sp. JM-1]